MPRKRTIFTPGAAKPRVLRNALLLLTTLSLFPFFVPAHASLPESHQQVETEAFTLTWARDLNSALQVGLAEYKPVLALFSLPSCAWCSRLKTELSSPSLRPVLASYVLVDVDASSSDIAQRYGIRGVPTVIFFSGDGRPRGGFSGYLPAPELKDVLAQHVHFDVGNETTHLQDEERVARLSAGTLQSEDWPGLMRQLGSPSQRESLRQVLLALKPFPASDLVALLASSDLAVRMGAIELLEERTGEDRGFDPWIPPLDFQAEPLRKRWQDWLTANPTFSTNDTSTYAPLTDSRIAAYILDILGEDRERTARAMQMLEAGGHHAALQLAAFVRDHPDLAPGLRRRLREVQYAILLHATTGHQASATAHQIVFGNLDTRIRTIAALPQTGAGIRAIPILQDLLADENPLLREAACESILGITGGIGTVLIVPFLKTESDVNVTFSALRALGRTKSPRAVMALLPFLEHGNEDLVVVALEGLAKLQYTAIVDPLAARLKDPRWRVRVATLEAIAELKIDSLRDPVAAVLNDEDPFVRQAAIQALAAISKPAQFAASATTLFHTLPEQRAVILKAMAQHDLDIPRDFIDVIAEDDDPDRIIACLGATADLEKRALELAGRLVTHANPDISAAALHILMRFGVGNSTDRRHIIHALQTRSGDELASLLEDLLIDSDDFQPFALQFRHWLKPNGDSNASAATSPSLDRLQSILDAFEKVGALSKSPVSPSKSPSIEDLIAAFENVAPSTANSSSSAIRPASFPDLIHEMEILTTNENPRVAFLAAVRLVTLGNSGLVPKLVDHLDERTPAEREQVAEALGSISTPDAMAINRSLLSDSSEEIRSRATANLIDNFTQEGFVALVDELLRPGTPLRASELSLRYRASKLSANLLRQQGHRLLASDPASLQALGILLSASAWEEGDIDLLAPFLNSENPYVHAAAIRVLGIRAPAQFLAHLPLAVQDASPIVRTAIAFACMNSSSSENIPLSKDDTVGLALERESRTLVAPLETEEKVALRTLAQDVHPPVRFRALLALLSRGETIDASHLASALDSLTDSNRAASELLNVISSRGNDQPRPELKALGASLRRQLSDSYWQGRIDKLLGPPMTEEDLLAVHILTRFDTPDIPELLTLDRPDASMETTSNSPPTLIFFYQPGCKECQQVETLLDAMPRYFENLHIHTHNVRHHKAALLNEALCDRFGVPGNARLVAPALFAADGALIGSAITFDSLADLLSRSASREDGHWFAPEQAVLDAAEKSIQNRYSETIQTGVIALIALADGINPCAFATIIFLLSYLHIARRNSRQLLQVGIAFILGVFLAYLAMGFGLITLLDRIAFLGGLSRIVNGAMAAFVLLIALLSFRDGILCLRGRMGDMTLQLPGTFKQQIHTVIRHGARHRRFVLAAFAIGILIAIIELPCTGQAYLPTIAYMVRDAQLRIHALLHLLLYNILFIVPLVIIFVLAALGMTHERLADVLQKRAALVKFATALLFLVLFGVFLRTL